MAGISVQKDIDASAKRVWDIFSEISTYEEWNPFIVKAVGALRYDTQLHMTIMTPSGSKVRFSPRVIELARGSRMVWTTGMRLPGVFARVVVFQVEPTGGSSCRFTITVEPRGLLVPFKKGFISGLESGYSTMLDALKSEAEKPQA